MLDLVRRGVKSWVAKVLLGILVASFAVFGIGDVFSNSLGSSVASVGDQKVSAERFLAAFDGEMRGASQRFGQPIDVQLARQLGLDQQVLSRLASEATLDQTMEELSISAPDAVVADTIIADPSFQAAGQFDDAQYKYLIAQNGFTIESYEEQTRRALARNQLTAALVAGATAPAGAAEVLFAYQGETRRIDYITLSLAEHAEDPGEADEATLSAHHEANPDLFSAPEMRDAVYLHVSIDEMARDFSPDETELQALYDARSSLYQQPERRDLYQTIFDAEADAAAAKARIDAGELDFDALLAERDETRADTSLGEVTRGDLAEATAAAAFDVTGEGVVGPVDTGFGFVLIEVAAITPAETIPFEDARAELAIDLQREAAVDAAPGIAGEIDDLRAGGATLEEIAGDLGLVLGQATGVSADNRNDDLTGDPAFIADLFASEEGEERDVVETEDGGYFVLRLDGVTDAALRPLDDVRTEVTAHWRSTRLAESLRARAEALVERLNDGELLAVVADELGVDVQTEGPKTRAEGWAAITGELVEGVFDAPMGGAGYSATPNAPGLVTVATVVGVEAPEADEPRLEALRAQLGQMTGSDALQLFLSAKQEEAGVSINSQLLESLLSQSGY